MTHISAEVIEPPPTGASREEVREYRRKVNTQKLIKRDEGRRRNNVFIGQFFSINTVLSKLENDYSDETATLEISSASVGLLIGYRTHIAKKFGFKSSIQMAISPTMVSLVIDKSYTARNNTYIDFYTSNGSEGMTYTTEIKTNLIIGPFWRFAIEPGIGYSYVSYSDKTIYLEGDAGDGYMDLEPNLQFISALIDCSLMLGQADQWNINFGINLGAEMDDSSYTQLGVNMGITYSLGWEE